MKNEERNEVFCERIDKTDHCWDRVRTLHGRLTRWRSWSACNVGEATEGLKNELWRRWSNGRVGECATSQLILQPFRRFTYVTAHSRTLPLLHLLHSSFSNPSFASPTSQALHLIHLASRPWNVVKMRKSAETIWNACIEHIKEENEEWRDNYQSTRTSVALALSIGRCSRVGEGQLFENKPQWKR